MPSLSQEIGFVAVTTLVNILAVVVGVAVSREWSRAAVAAILVIVLFFNGAAFVVQVMKVRREHTREAAILSRKGQLVRLLGEEIDKASQIEYRLESLMTRRAMTQQALDGFVTEIDKWRTGVGKELDKMLPETYAARVFLSSRGDFPGADLAVGSGASVGFAMTPGFYQYTHVRECRRALTAILAGVDSFVRLSTDLPQGE